MYPTYPYLSDTQWTQMRQQWIRALKMLRVGMISTVPERYRAYRYGHSNRQLQRWYFHSITCSHHTVGSQPYHSLPVVLGCVLCCVVWCGVVLFCVLLCCFVLNCVVLCCVVLCCVVLCCVVLCCVVLCCVVLCCVVLCCVVLCCVVLCCVVLCCVVCYVVLCCIILCYTQRTTPHHKPQNT